MKEFNKAVAEVVGQLCKILLPIKDEYYFGAGKEIAICTLSSLNLLTQISEDKYLMEKIALVGRLLSENKGIDAIINYSARNKYPKAYRSLWGRHKRSFSGTCSIITISKWDRLARQNSKFKESKTSDHNFPRRGRKFSKKSAYL